MEQNFNEENNFRNESEPVVETKATSSYSYEPVRKFRTSYSFGKSVVIPFASGIIGATLVIGTCFGVPSVKEKILGKSTSTISTPNSSESTTTAISLSNYSDTSIQVANKVLPSIVGIQVEYSVNSIFGRKYNSTATAEGSGIVISSDGYILTNNHIVDTSSNSSNSTYYSVDESSKITVKLYNDDTTYEATIVGTDELTDLAVIKIEASNLTPAELGNSDSVKVGEFAMAVGNPLGLQSSITCGVISALNREVTDTDGKVYTLTQTDAAINSGNSGGALVNSEGKVIGINTLKLSGTGVEGMGFAIPINSTVDIYNQLIEFNKVKRPYIGITGIDLDEDTAKRNNLVVGVYVKSVEDFSAAQKANIQAGDVITAVNGTTIKTMDELNNIKNEHKIGDLIELTINRNGNETKVSLTLGEQP